MKQTLIILIVSFSPFMFSAISDLQVEGIVISYDKKHVVLAQDTGQKVKVPRARIPKYYKLKTGRRVHAVLDSKKFLKMIKAQEEAKKKGKKPLGVDTKISQKAK